MYTNATPNAIAGAPADHASALSPPPGVGSPTQQNGMQPGMAPAPAAPIAAPAQATPGLPVSPAHGGGTQYVTGAYMSMGDEMVDRMLQLERALKLHGNCR